MLYRLADAIEEHAEELARLESRDVGKPITTARGELPFVVDNLRFFAGACRVMEGRAPVLEGEICDEGLVYGALHQRRCPRVHALREAVPLTIDSEGEHGTREERDPDYQPQHRQHEDGVREILGWLPPTTLYDLT
jgi:Aldehyde dehydrogenase family